MTKVLWFSDKDMSDVHVGNLETAIGDVVDVVRVWGTGWTAKDIMKAVEIHSCDFIAMNMDFNLVTELMMPGVCSKVLIVPVYFKIPTTGVDDEVVYKYSFAGWNQMEELKISYSALD